MAHYASKIELDKYNNLIKNKNYDELLKYFQNFISLMLIVNQIKKILKNIKINIYIGITKTSILL